MYILLDNKPLMKTKQIAFFGHVDFDRTLCIREKKLEVKRIKKECVHYGNEAYILRAWRKNAF